MPPVFCCKTGGNIFIDILIKRYIQTPLYPGYEALELFRCSEINVVEAGELTGEMLKFLHLTLKIATFRLRYEIEKILSRRSEFTLSPVIKRDILKFLRSKLLCRAETMRNVSEELFRML